MPNPIEVAFLTKCRAAALAAAQAWESPWLLSITREDYAGAAAAEAWCETGGIHFPPNSNNVLGIKATHSSWSGPTVLANGTEQLNDGSWTGPQSDLWCVFEDIQACYAQQLHILHNAKDTHGDLLYSAALSAIAVGAYITHECLVWSTALAKGICVTQTYNAHADILAADQPSS